MERKKASALVSLLMVLLASFALTTPTLSSPGSKSHKYWVMTIDRKMPGNVIVYDHIAAATEESQWNFTIPPLFVSQNITFSDPWELDGVGWIVNLTVPATSYVGLSYTFWSTDPPMWFRFSTSMSQDGYGWIFLNDTGDVDCHTFSNNTATYWYEPSPNATNKAADHGAAPSPGPDGVGGTADDGFGDGTNDTRGSSILVLPTMLNAEQHTGGDWAPLFTMPWPQIFTTGNATARIIESVSLVDGARQTVEGKPWEFYAGIEHPPAVPQVHPKWNAYVTYAAAWSMLDIDTALGDYDICFTITEKMVREDVLIADINCDEVCNIIDIVIAALAFDTEGMNAGPDGLYYTDDDKKVEDPDFDARGDIRPDRNKVNIVDIVRIALDFDEKLEP